MHRRFYQMCSHPVNRRRQVRKTGHDYTFDKNNLHECIVMNRQFLPWTGIKTGFSAADLSVFERKITLNNPWLQIYVNDDYTFMQTDSKPTRYKPCSPATAGLSIR